MIVSYVILHYLAMEDTIKAVESILNNIVPCTTNSIHIVVVDNGSSDNSFFVLNDRFSQIDKVHILKCNENIGFARGNNVGYAFSKYELRADFIVLLNNDTVIEQKNFTEVLIKKYTEKEYYVLGPDIVALDGYHQNPGKKQYWSNKEIILFRLKKRMLILLSLLQFSRIASYPKQNARIYDKEAKQGDVENTTLHGACLIFSPKYIKRFDGLYDKTFLYMEEDILKLFADYYDFLMMYTSELKIFHKEDSATNMICQSEGVKFRRKCRFLIHSSKLYSRLKRKMKIKKFLTEVIGKFASKAKGREYKIDLDIPIFYIISFTAERMLMLIRGKWKCIGIAKKGKKIFCGKSVTLKCKNKIKLGSGVSLYHNVYIDALSHNGVRLGECCSIGSGTIIRCSGNMSEIGEGFWMGDNSSLADNCFVGATGGVHIGDDVIGGQNIRFHASNHKFTDSTRLIREQGIDRCGISVGNNCWIGAGVVFCDGVKVGNGCVIGTNSVITKSFPDNCVIAGNPARIIRSRVDT